MAQKLISTTLLHSHWSCLCYRWPNKKNSILTLLLLTIVTKIHSFGSLLVWHSYWSWSCCKPILSILVSAIGVKNGRINNSGYSLCPNNIMNVKKCLHVKGKILNINWWVFTLLHIQPWGFIYKLQIVKFHPEMYTFGLIKK